MHRNSYANIKRERERKWKNDWTQTKSNPFVFLPEQRIFHFANLICYSWLAFFESGQRRALCLSRFFSAVRLCFCFRYCFSLSLSFTHTAVFSTSQFSHSKMNHIKIEICNSMKSGHSSRDTNKRTVRIKRSFNDPPHENCNSKATVYHSMDLSQWLVLILSLHFNPSTTKRNAIMTTTTIADKKLSFILLRFSYVKIDVFHVFKFIFKFFFCDTVTRHS